MQELAMKEEEIGVPKKKSVILLVILGIITLGIHQFFWLIKRSPELNNLNTKTKPRKKIIILSAITHLLSIIVLISTIIYFNLTNQTIAYDISQVPLMFIIAFSVFVFLELFSCIIYLASCFKVRKILNETLENKHGDMSMNKKLKVSGFYTLIFQIYYLQYEINRIIDDKEDQKKKAPLITLILAVIIVIVSVLIIPTISLLKSPIN